MKAGTESKIKFKRFKRRLKLPHWQAVGILEAIWQLTAHSAPEGDIGRHSNEDIAASIEYDGDEDELVSALIDSGWLDACEVHRLVVHDWSEHAPNYVKGNIQRHGKQFIKASPGEPPKEPPKEPPREPPQGILPPSLVKPSQAKPSQAKPSQVNDSVKTAAAVRGVTPEDFISRWNHFVKDKPSLAKVLKLTDERRKKLKIRLKDPDWFNAFKLALNRLPLPTSEGSTWQPTLDWLIRNESNVYRISEGEFGWRAKDDPARQRLETHRTKLITQEHERQLKQEQVEHRQNAKSTHNAIGNILEATDGGDESDGEKSLLFG